MNHIGKETTITVGGKQYTLSRLERPLLREFAEWVHSHTPDPLEACAAHYSKYSPDMQKFMMQLAWNDNKKRMDIEGPEVREATNTVEGTIKLLQLLLRKHHPELTEDEVFDLGQQHLAEEIERRLVKVREQHPDLAEEDARRLIMEDVAGLPGSFRFDLSAV